MRIVPVEVMIKSAASPNTLRTHLIVSAPHAVVDRQKTKPMALLYRMLMSHHKPCGADISKTCAGAVYLARHNASVMTRSLDVRALLTRDGDLRRRQRNPWHGITQPERTM